MQEIIYHVRFLGYVQVKANPWLLWLLGALLFFAEYFVRTSSSVMVGDLMHAFAVDAAGIGSLAAYFYYPYTLMQIPVGFMVDNFHSGKLLTIMASVFAVACFIFAGSKTIFCAEFARFLMGFSASFAFVGTLKLVTEKFDSSVLGLLAGTTQALGMMGAAVGEGPVAVMVGMVGWRLAMNYMGLFVAVIALALAVFAWSGDKRSAIKVKLRFKQAIVENKQAILNAIFAGLLYAPTLAFGELWGVSYLQAVQHVPHESAAVIVSWIFIGWGIGGPLQGLISDRIGKRKPLFYFASCCSFLFMLLILYGGLPNDLLTFVMFCYGLSNSGLVIAYAVSGEINPANVTGTTIAVTNMASVILGALCQPIIGKLLVVYWDHGVDKLGDPIYSAEAFQYAMVFLPLVLFVSAIVGFFIKETNCCKVVE